MAGASFICFREWGEFVWLELARVLKGNQKNIEVYHCHVDKGEVMYLQYNEKAKIKGKFFAETNSEGFVRKIEVKGRDNDSSVF